MSWVEKSDAGWICVSRARLFALRTLTVVMALCFVASEVASAKSKAKSRHPAANVTSENALKRAKYCIEEQNRGVDEIDMDKALTCVHPDSKSSSEAVYRSLFSQFKMLGMRQNIRVGSVEVKSIDSDVMFVSYSTSATYSMGGRSVSETNCSILEEYHIVDGVWMDFKAAQTRCR